MANKLLKDIAIQQRDAAKSVSTVGVIGLHMVSGPLVGFAIGYGLDHWLDLTPWCGMIFLFVGIIAGFLNVWRDTRVVMNKMDKTQSP